MDGVVNGDGIMASMAECTIWDTDIGVRAGMAMCGTTLGLFLTSMTTAQAGIPVGIIMAVFTLVWVVIPDGWVVASLQLVATTAMQA